MLIFFFKLAKPASTRPIGPSAIPSKNTAPGDVISPALKTWAAASPNIPKEAPCPISPNPAATLRPSPTLAPVFKAFVIRPAVPKARESKAPIGTPRLVAYSLALSIVSSSSKALANSPPSLILTPA